MAVWRLDSSGALDATFNGQGWFTHRMAAAGSTWDAGRDMCIDASGRIVVVGESQTSATGFDMVIWWIR